MVNHVESLRQIENGTFAGECIVDCFETVAVTSSEATYSLTSRLPDRAHPDIRVAEPLDSARWSQLVSLVDVERVATLPPRVGLPDAADSGGEFVTIAVGDRVTRVEFEPEAVPAPLQRLIGPLRELRAQLASRHGR